MSICGVFFKVSSITAQGLAAEMVTGPQAGERIVRAFVFLASILRVLCGLHGDSSCGLYGKSVVVACLGEEDPAAGDTINQPVLLGDPSGPGAAPQMFEGFGLS